MSLALVKSLMVTGRQLLWSMQAACGKRAGRWLPDWQNSMPAVSDMPRISCGRRTWHRYGVRAASEMAYALIPARLNLGRGSPKSSGHQRNFEVGPPPGDSCASCRLTRGQGPPFPQATSAIHPTIHRSHSHAAPRLTGLVGGFDVSPHPHIISTQQLTVRPCRLPRSCEQRYLSNSGLERSMASSLTSSEVIQSYGKPKTKIDRCNRGPRFGPGMARR